MKPNASEEAKLRNKQQAREKFDELKMRVWCEIIQSLGKRSAMFLRPYKEDGPKAWAVMCDRYKSCERPRLQQLIEKLTILKMVIIESVIDYITRAEELHGNLREVDEQLSEPMLISIILKVLTEDFDNFVTICKFSKDEQNLHSIKRDLVNFEYDKRQRSNDERQESTFFGSNRQKPKLNCHFCGKMGHKEAFCFANHSNKRNVKCHNCGNSGHVAKDCRKPKQNKKYCSFCKMNNHDRSKFRKLKNGTSNNESAILLREMNSADEKGFCVFASSDKNVLATNEVDIIIDSGCTNYMLKYRELFAT